MRIRWPVTDLADAANDNASVLAVGREARRSSDPQDIGGLLPAPKSARPSPQINQYSVCLAAAAAATTTVAAGVCKPRPVIHAGRPSANANLLSTIVDCQNDRRWLTIIVADCRAVTVRSRPQDRIDDGNNVTVYKSAAAEFSGHGSSSYSPSTVIASVLPGHTLLRIMSLHPVPYLPTMDHFIFR